MGIVGEGAVRRRENGAQKIAHKRLRTLLENGALATYHRGAQGNVPPREDHSRVGQQIRVTRRATGRATGNVSNANTRDL